MPLFPRFTVEYRSLLSPGRAAYNPSPGFAMRGNPFGVPMGDPSQGRPSFEIPPPDRLDSWKEIAAHLRRDVTTVQRWEKRGGMPVHRHVHDKAGSVYAFSAELDAWAGSRKLRAIQESGTEAPAPIPHGVPPTATAKLRIRWRIVLPAW